MSYLQCSASITQGDAAEQLWLDARGVAECRFDMNGHLRR